MKNYSKVFSLYDQLKLSMIENSTGEGLGVIHDPYSSKHVEFEILRHSVDGDTQKGSWDLRLREEVWMDVWV